MHLNLALALDISHSMSLRPNGASASTLDIVLDCMQEICRLVCGPMPSLALHTIPQKARTVPLGVS